MPKPKKTATPAPDKLELSVTMVRQIESWSGGVCSVRMEMCPNCLAPDAPVEITLIPHILTTSYANEWAYPKLCVRASDLDSIAENLANCIAFGRRHNLLPPREPEFGEVGQPAERLKRIKAEHERKARTRPKVAKSA